MKKFNLLIIGNANHQYIISFSHWLRTVMPGLSITIVSFHPIINKAKASEHFDRYFEVPPNSGVINKINGFRKFYLSWKLVRLFKNNDLRADTILIHHVDPYFIYISGFLRKRSLNYTLALWGSDFYRAKPKFYLKTNLSFADNIVIGTPQMIDDFKLVFPSQMHKVSLCYYGNQPIENLKSFKEANITKQQSCSYFNMSADKINITIGHNGTKTHQHLLILNQLNLLAAHIKERIRIILPMTYGLNSEYLNEVTALCENCAFDFRIFTDFMTEEEVAHLRNSTDVMVNLQTTDAFSGSMREVLYCGGIVINGSWLPYQFLKDLNVYFEEVSSVAEISAQISDIVLNFSSYKNRFENNPSKIYQISSWSHSIQQWKEVIEKQR